MIKTSLFTLSILSVAILSACDSSVSSQSGSSSDSLMNLTRPSSLRSDISDADTTSQSDANSSGEYVTECVSEVFVNPTDESIESCSGEEFAGNSVDIPLEILHLDTELLWRRVDMARADLDTFDSSWSDIVDYCSGFSDGVKCDLPSSLLEGGATPSEVEDTDPTTPTTDLVTSEGLETRTVLASYTRNPSEDYDHAIELQESFGDSETTTKLYQWDQVRENIQTSANGSWEAGSFEFDMIYREKNSGDSVTLLEKNISGSNEYNATQHLQELNDGNNGVQLKTESDWKNEYESGEVSSLAFADDDGGKVSSKTSVNADGTSYVTYYRGVFGTDGGVQSSEYCIETDGIDCEDDGNWQNGTEGETGVSPVDESIIEGGEILTASDIEKLELSIVEDCAALEINDDGVCGPIASIPTGESPVDESMIDIEGGSILTPSEIQNVELSADEECSAEEIVDGVCGPIASIPTDEVPVDESIIDL